ncbi:hypothetical protein [Dyella silvatica]|uniref:hypothetical protein n=1 Tax=Dyella silvatica TaxID=2992128 RepID=UPI002258C2DE|nr:hypothetical protein [Dyella silvatica]
MKRLWIFLCGVSVALAAVGTAIAQESGDECQAAWQQSPASQSCESVMQNFGERGCGGKTRCKSGNSLIHIISYPMRLTVENVKKLVNCDGELRFDGNDCSTTTKYSTMSTHDDVKNRPLPQYDTHHEACSAAWSESSAQKTCVTVDYVARADEDKCKIHAQCSYGPGYVERDAANMVQTSPGSFALAGGGPRRSTVTVTEDDAKKLSNCDGYLKVGPCR